MNYVIITNISETTSRVKIQEHTFRTTNILVIWTKEKSPFIKTAKAALVNFWCPSDLDPVLRLFIFLLPHFSTLLNSPSTTAMRKDSILVFLDPDSEEMGTESHSEVWPCIMNKGRACLLLPEPLFSTERQYGMGRRKYS